MFLKNKNIIFKIRRSKVTDYAALKISVFCALTCADPDSFARGGPTLTMIFLVDEWRKDPSTTLSGPSSARQRNSFSVLLISLQISLFCALTCADPDSFAKGGPTLTMFFLVDEWRKDPSTTLSGPSSARQRNAI